MKLADSVGQIFGTIEPPISGLPANPAEALGKIIATGVKLFLIFAALAALVYGFFGAYDWIVSGGDKEKLAKAQQKITNAFVGVLVIIVVISAFGLITGNILGIIVNDPNTGWIFNIPHL